MFMNSQLTQPLVSVIIPTYNRPEYLKQAINSAVQQTYENIEIIVCDNCSSENPESLIESFNDSRIKFHRHPENIGMLANQLHAFKMAQGKYIASLHDDDMWNEDFLVKLVPPLEANPDLILAFCDQYIIDAQGQINYSGISTAAAAVIRNSLINWEMIPPEVGGMWDLYITYLCCISGHGVYYQPERLTRYRAHEQTDTMLSGKRNVQAKIRKGKSEIFCYQVFMEDERLKEFNSHFRKKWLAANTTLGIGLLRDQKILDARRYFWQTLSEQKFNLRTLAALIISFIPPNLTNKILNV